MAKDTITIDLTPTWSGILPAMLEAYANVRSKLWADGCNGQEDGWCLVHDASQDETFEECEVAVNGRLLSEWKDGVDKSLADLTSQFEKMAKAADLYNDIVREKESK